MTPWDLGPGTLRTDYEVLSRHAVPNGRVSVRALVTMLFDADLRALERLTWPVVPDGIRVTASEIGVDTGVNSDACEFTHAVESNADDRLLATARTRWVP